MDLKKYYNTCTILDLFILEISMHKPLLLTALFEISQHTLAIEANDPNIFLTLKKKRLINLVA